MEENELRIDNIVTIHNKESWSNLKDVPMIVTGINKCLGLDNMPTYSVSMIILDSSSVYRFQIYSQFIEFIKPIPLTEEILLKCGFKQRKHCQGFYINMPLQSTLLSYRRSQIRICPFNQTPSLAIDCIYLHQLQNIYLVLTQTELEINL